jgi:SAM-dependent methyltransferase
MEGSKAMDFDQSDAAKINLEEAHWHEEEIPLEQHSLYRKIDQIMSARPVGTVLEVGCASGRYLEVLRKRGWSVQGLELQPQDAEYIAQHDLRDPFPVEPVDVLIAAEVVEHLVDTEGFLANCANALRPGGELILTTPNLLFLGNRLLMLFGRPPRFAYADFHVRMFVWDDLRTKLEKRFEVSSLRGSHVLMGLQRAPRLGPMYARLGDRLPGLAAHFIVTARRR